MPADQTTCFEKGQPFAQPGVNHNAKLKNASTGIRATDAARIAYQPAGTLRVFGLATSPRVPPGEKGEGRRVGLVRRAPRRANTAASWANGLMSREGLHESAKK